MFTKEGGGVNFSKSVEMGGGQMQENILGGKLFSIMPFQRLCCCFAQIYQIKLRFETLFTPRTEEPGPAASLFRDPKFSL